MTYKDLLNELSELEEDQLDMPVMVDVDEEFYPIVKVELYDEKDGRLEDCQPFLKM